MKIKSITLILFIFCILFTSISVPTYASKTRMEKTTETDDVKNNEFITLVKEHIKDHGLLYVCASVVIIILMIREINKEDGSLEKFGFFGELLKWIYYLFY